MNQMNSNLADFMQDVEKLQEQIVSLRERLALVDENKDKVRPKIYEKVRSDYEKNLKLLFDELSPFQVKINEEIEQLKAVIADLTERFEDREEELEELELRFLAGEFDPGDYEPKQIEFKSEMDDLQAQISERTDAIHQYENRLRMITGEPVEEELAEVADVEELQESEEIEEATNEIIADTGDSIDYANIESVESYDPDPLTAFESTATETDQSIDSEFSQADPIMVDDLKPVVPEYEEFSEDYDYSSEKSQNIYDETPMDETLGVAHESIQDVKEPESGATGEEYIWTTTPVLDVIEGDFAGESYPMDKERITIGRGPNNDIQLATDTSVSRHHAQITFENNRYVVVDLESSNGTSVNGIRITRSYLRPNDEVMIGQSKLVMRPS